MLDPGTSGLSTGARGGQPPRRYLARKTERTDLDLIYLVPWGHVKTVPPAPSVALTLLEGGQVLGQVASMGSAGSASGRPDR